MIVIAVQECVVVEAAALVVKMTLKLQENTIAYWIISIRTGRFKHFDEKIKNKIYSIELKFFNAKCFFDKQNGFIFQIVTWNYTQNLPITVMYYTIIFFWFPASNWWSFSNTNSISVFMNLQSQYFSRRCNCRYFRGLHRNIIALFIVNLMVLRSKCIKNFCLIIILVLDFQKHHNLS